MYSQPKCTRYLTVRIGEFEIIPSESYNDRHSTRKISSLHIKLPIKNLLKQVSILPLITRYLSVLPQCLELVSLYINLTKVLDTLKYNS